MIQWHYTQIFLHTGDLADSGHQNMVRIADNLLLTVIEPLLHHFQPIIQTYFFLRYQENGYHIRLRIRADKNAYQNQIYPALVRDMLAFREANPIIGTIPPEQFLQQATYEPELDKYGGETGIATAEAQFEISSQIALKILRLEQDKHLPRSVLALTLMRAIVNTIFSQPMQTSLFLSAYIRYWLVGKEEASALPLLYQYATEKRTILSHANKLASHPSVQAWIGDIKTSINDFFRLEDEAQLQTSIKAYLYQQANQFIPVLPHPITTLLIMPNFIHLLHNRLGISIFQEAQLASILYFNHEPLAPHQIHLVLEPSAFDWLQTYYAGYQ